MSAESKEIMDEPHHDLHHARLLTHIPWGSVSLREQRVSWFLGSLLSFGYANVLVCSLIQNRHCRRSSPLDPFTSLWIDSMPVDDLHRMDHAQEKLKGFRTKYNFGSSTAWRLGLTLRLHHPDVAAAFRVRMVNFGVCVYLILPLVNIYLH